METIYQQIEREVIQKGMQKVLREVVRNAFRKGYSENQIADFTGYTMDDILKIKKAWLSTKKSKKTQ
jgi:hypothetical protein